MKCYQTNRIVLRDYSKPIKARHRSCGHYYFDPQPNAVGRHGVGGYLKNGELSEGSTARLRVYPANDFLRYSRLSNISGYYYDDDYSETMQPIVARLPQSRGFLAGWTMGEGMATQLGGYIYADIEGAARAAHGEAEQAAESEREYQLAERERREREEKDDEEISGEEYDGMI